MPKRHRHDVDDIRLVIDDEDAKALILSGHVNDYWGRTLEIPENRYVMLPGDRPTGGPTQGPKPRCGETPHHSQNRPPRDSRPQRAPALPALVRDNLQSAMAEIKVTLGERGSAYLTLS